MALRITKVGGGEVNNDNLNGLKAEQAECGGINLTSIVGDKLLAEIQFGGQTVYGWTFDAVGQEGHEHFRDNTYVLKVTNETTGAVEEFEMVLSEAKPRRVIVYMMGAPDGSNPGDNLEGDAGGGDLLSRLMQALGKNGPLDDGNIGSDGSGLGFGDPGNDKTVN